MKKVMVCALALLALALPWVARTTGMVSQPAPAAEAERPADAVIVITGKRPGGR
jgi:hypothetical protein